MDPPPPKRLRLGDLASSAAATKPDEGNSRRLRQFLEDTGRTSEGMTGFYLKILDMLEEWTRNGERDVGVFSEST